VVTLLALQPDKRQVNRMIGKSREHDYAESCSSSWMMSFQMLIRSTLDALGLTPGDMVSDLISSSSSKGGDLQLTAGGHIIIISSSCDLKLSPLR
jgi:hypothetical protein